MLATELLSFQLDNVGNQLQKALDGITDSQCDHKVCSTAMTVRDMLEHLAECYHAMLEEAAGREHEWGNYSIGDKSLDNLMNVVFELREQACKAALTGDDARLKSGFSFIVEHDAYHLGQICLVRMETNPEWNPYSLYE